MRKDSRLEKKQKSSCSKGVTSKRKTRNSKHVELNKRARMKRHIYLKKKTLEEAEAIASDLAKLIHLETEMIPVTQSLGRVIAEPLFAKISSPPFHCAAMDGIAIMLPASSASIACAAGRRQRRRAGQVRMK
ncbi:MAG: molybdenum cofactor synthesis domain protein, partial [Deltaproteobacteria bacterium]|nr:molybdenum cofactor synthesis domain protein [Deltaproteobacteria bacterium]